MNATHNALANGSRANATIGRAVRLVILNVLGGVPGQLDRSTLGHPGQVHVLRGRGRGGQPVAAAVRRAGRARRAHRR